jgi:radical SAM superfamily enzyme YgiQ (UPF0313 family)
VGFSATHEFLTASLELARRLRDEGFDGHITMGGYLPTFLHESLLAEFPQLDSIVRGEGENTLIALLKRLDSPARWDEVPGISFRRDGSVRANPAADLIADLDSLPFPARDTLPDLARMYDYSAMSTSRGCPMGCSFCSIRSFYRLSRGPVWRARSARSVADEMEILAGRHGVGQIALTDDNFMGIPGEGRVRAFQIAREILSRGLKVEFSILMRVNDLEEGLLRLLKLAGLRSLFVGFESGVDRCLSTFGKGITAVQNRQGIELIKRLEIKCFPGFIMFDPYTTLEEVRENLNFVDFAEKGTDLVRIDDLLGSLQPFTGTPIRDRLEEEGRLVWPPSSLIAPDAIPTYYVADCRVETLRRAAKGLRGMMKRPDFDRFALLCRRKLANGGGEELSSLQARFNGLVERMRAFEKASFREFMERIEKTPGIRPEEWESLTGPLAPALSGFNGEVEGVNGEIAAHFKT